MSIMFNTQEKFFSNIDSKKQYLSLKEQDFSNYIKENYKKVSFMGIDEICTKSNLTKEEINEFAFKVGFEGYENLRNNLRQVILTQLKSTDRFQIFVNLDNINISKVTKSVISTEIKNLTSLIDSVDLVTLKEIVKKIINAEDMIVIGTRSSAPIAIYAEYIFNRISKKTRKIVSGGTENFDLMGSIDRDTLILAFGFSRYPKETIKALNFFKKRNFKIISITDNLMSPLSQFSDIVLTVPYESISFTDSYGVPIAIINILITIISQHNSEATLKHLNKFEEIAKDMGFFF